MGSSMGGRTCGWGSSGCSGPPAWSSSVANVVGARVTLGCPQGHSRLSPLLSTFLCTSGTQLLGDATTVPRVRTWHLWVEISSHKCHHSELIPDLGFFYLFFICQPLFPPSRPSPVGISYLVSVAALWE